MLLIGAKFLLIGVKFIISFAVALFLAYFILFACSWVIQTVVRWLGRDIGNLNTWLKAIWKRRQKAVTCEHRYDMFAQPPNKWSVKCTNCKITVSENLDLPSAINLVEILNSKK